MTFDAKKFNRAIDAELERFGLADDAHAIDDIDQYATIGPRTAKRANSHDGKGGVKPLKLTFFDECLEIKPKNWIIKGVIAKDENSSWFGPPKSIKSGLLL